MASRVINTRYYPLVVPVPGQTAIAAPVTVPVAFGSDVMWVDVELEIPDGHLGLTGIRFEMAGEPIVPWGRPSSWIISNNMDRIFDVGTQSAGVNAVAYNTDVNAHSFYCRFKVQDIGTDAPATDVQLIPIEDLS